MDIQHYRVVPDGDGSYTLELHIGFNEEFASELGHSPQTKQTLLQEARRFAKEQYPNIKIKTIKIVAGAMILGVINLGDIANIEAKAESVSTYQVVSGYPTVTHTVKSGDTLFSISNQYKVSVTELKEFNNLKVDTIYVGQNIKIPMYSYIVSSGDSLYGIAKKLNSSVTVIKETNNLATDQIYIGQRLLVPVAKVTTEIAPAPEQAPTAPAPSTETTSQTETTAYTVKSGDYLSVIAKNFGTTTQEIQRLNSLTSTVIYPGQVLIVPKQVTTAPSSGTTTPEQPATTTEPSQATQQQTTYTVVSGDTLSLIAQKHNITVDAIKSENQLTTDMIYVGQKLTIPVVVTTTPEPAPTAPATEQSTVETTTYTVVSGDTLNAIANRYKTTVTNIKQLNNLQSDMIYVGQNLTVPKPAPVVDQTPPASPTIEALQVVRQANVNAYDIKGKTEAMAKVVLSATDATGKSVRQEGTADAEGNYQFKQDFTSLQDGTITIEVTAIDEAGNESTAQKVTVTKDVLAPTNVAITDNGSITTKNQLAYQISGGASGASKVKIELTDEVNKTVRDESPVSTNQYQKSINTSGLQDGKITVKVTAIDTNGNESSPITRVLIKDTTGPNSPVLTVPDHINTENQNAVTLTGTTEPGSVVAILISDNTNKLTKQVTADANGNFTLTIDARIYNEGTITIAAKSIDSAGNESEAKTVKLVKDVSVADLVVAEPININSDLVSAYTFSGISGEPNTNVNVSMSDSTGKEVSQTVQTDADGNFTTTFNLETLQDGAVTILAYQTDAVGNKSNIITKVVNKDTTAPSAIVVNPLQVLSQENRGEFTFSGTGEPFSNVHATFIDNTGTEVTEQIMVQADGTFSTKVDLSALKGDILEITTVAKDGVGNASIASTSSTAIDITGPGSLDLNFLTTVNAEYSNDFILDGISEPNATVEIEFSDGTNTIISHSTSNEEGNFTTNTDLSRLSDGTITGRVLTKDAVGNAGVTKEFTLTKDTAVTDVTSVETGDAGKVSSANVGAYSISGTSQEEGAVVTIEVTDGVASVKETALVVDGSFQIPVDLTSLADGPLQVTVKQQDIAGNSSGERTATIQKDATVQEPVVQVSKLTKTSAGYTYNIQGIGEKNGTVTVTISGQSSPVTITNNYTLSLSDKFNATIDISSLNGQKPFITVTQVDSFGNESKQQITGVSSYVVGSGDNLWKISTLLGTTIEELRSLNQLSTDMVYIGQQLKVPLVAGLQQTAISEEQFFNMGYLYHGSSNTYMESMQQTAGSINVVSPTYFDLNADGSLKLTQVVDRYFIASMQSNGIRVVPFLSNHWDRTLGEKALDNREQLTDQIAEAVRVYNLDGVNIDIENVTHEYRDEYSDFAKMLRAKIPADKEVSVAVAANPYNYTLGWHGSYDYNSLGSSSDYLMVMAYDESYTGSKPGPVASIQFVEKSIQYAINSGVPKDKIVLGIGHYGRYWIEGAAIGGNAMSNEHVAQAVTLYNGVVTFDQQSMSPKATFTIKQGDPTMSVYGKTLQPGNYTVWFENEESIRAKFELVEKYGIKGTGNWGVEQENPQFWKSFSEWVQP